LVTVFFVASVWVNRAAIAIATSATAAAKINMTRRGVSHAPRTAPALTGVPELTGVSPRSSHEMLI
jgi:hypothetical protein